MELQQFHHCLSLPEDSPFEYNLSPGMASDTLARFLADPSDSIAEDYHKALFPARNGQHNDISPTSKGITTDDCDAFTLPCSVGFIGLWVFSDMTAMAYVCGKDLHNRRWFPVPLSLKPDLETDCGSFHVAFSGHNLEKLTITQPNNEDATFVRALHATQSRSTPELLQARQEFKKRIRRDLNALRLRLVKAKPVARKIHEPEADWKTHNSILPWWSNSLTCYGKSRTWLNELTKALAERIAAAEDYNTLTVILIGRNIGNDGTFHPVKFVFATRQAWTAKTEYLSIEDLSKGSQRAVQDALAILDNENTPCPPFRQIYQKNGRAHQICDFEASKNLEATGHERIAAGVPFNKLKQQYLAAA